MRSLSLLLNGQVALIVELEIVVIVALLNYQIQFQLKNLINSTLIFVHTITFRASYVLITLKGPMAANDFHFSLN